VAVFHTLIRRDTTMPRLFLTHSCHDYNEGHEERDTMQNKQIQKNTQARGAFVFALLGFGLSAIPALAQKGGAPAPPTQPNVNQAGVNPGAAEKTPGGSTSPGGAGLQIVPASPGDANTYKLVPDGSGGFKLVPASASDTNTYKLVPIATPTVPVQAPPQQMYAGFQASTITQHVFPFHSPYAGAQSFLSRNETETTDTYTIYVGYRLNSHLEAYIDPEVSRGHGLSTGYGLGGFTNGDVVRTPTLDQTPYLARYVLREVIPVGKETESVAQGEVQLAGPRPTHRIVISGGKEAVADLFDVNRYANSTRTQFMNWGLINCAAYDYAADTRGYTQGGAIEYITPSYAVRFGVFQMPKIANFIQLSSDYKNNFGSQAELEMHPSFLATKAGPGIVRVLGYYNRAHMGDYRASIALAKQTGTTPDITATETTGNKKYGYVIGYEQPLADEGNTGLFGRVGYNDGKTEDFAYTECDRTGSVGFQLSGTRIHRPDDVFALAVEQNDLSSAHADYLAAGGSGFLLGDGRLHYGSERLLETYYNYQLSRHGAATTIFVTADYQHIKNPGYNQDRGPADVTSLRVHLEL